MNKKELIEKVKGFESEERYRHTLSMADMAVSLADCYEVDRDLAWQTAMLHDVAKDMSTEEMYAVAEKYGHKIGDFSIRYPENLHAEIGAIIAEHEFGLEDKDALDAIRYHVAARPDMSILEKIIYFSDFAEPTRPNYATMQYLYRVARQNIDYAIIRGLRLLLEYQESHQIPGDIREICCNAFDFILEEQIRKRGADSNDSVQYAEMLTDAEFDEAMEVIHRNGLPLSSVKNARYLGGYLGDRGRKVCKGRVIRSDALSNLTKQDADYLKNVAGLTLVIDLRTAEEVEKSPDVRIPGVRYENIPLSEEFQTDRMDFLKGLYKNSVTENERAWYLSEYARIDEVRQMYYNISVDQNSRNAIRRIFRLILEEEGTVLFHCTSGKDRTGIIAALILYALGCDRTDIIRDYNASAIVYMALVESMKEDLRIHGYGTELQEGVQTILGVVPEVIAAGFYYIDSNYATNQELLLEAAGFDPDSLRRFQDKLLV